jgi:hypothetical protein
MKSNGVRRMRESRPVNGSYGSNVKLLDSKRLTYSARSWQLAEKHHTAASRAVGTVSQR